MRILLPFLTALLAAAATFGVLRLQEAEKTRMSSMTSLARSQQVVELRLQQISGEIRERLIAFGNEVATDQMFSLRLFAENNPSAAEIVSKAGQFMKPMGFGVLTVVDSGGIILSSGDFPTSVGNSAADKTRILGRDPKIYTDTIIGQSEVTLQAKVKFTLADNIPVYCMGGLIIDQKFLAALPLQKDVDVFFKNGQTIIGRPGVETISYIKGGRAIVNNKEYPAFSIPLQSAGAGDAPMLIGVLH